MASVLDEVFSSVTVEVEPFSFCEMSSRGWLDMPQNACASLHYVLSGTGALHLNAKPPVPIGVGDLVLVPAGSKHSLGASDGRFASFANCQPAAFGLSHHRARGIDDELGLQVLCADISVGLSGAGQVIDLLRAPIVEPALDPNLIELVVAELVDPGPGSLAQVKALLQFVIIALLRKSVARNDPGTAWFVALADRQLWPALAEVIAAPSADHTVESLANLVGMSRARFAARFKSRYGTGPMQLVKDLRLQHAARLLIEGKSGIARVAEQTGFASRSHFSQAFKERYGASPARFCKTENAQSGSLESPKS